MLGKCDIQKFVQKCKSKTTSGGLRLLLCDCIGCWRTMKCSKTPPTLLILFTLLQITMISTQPDTSSVPEPILTQCSELRLGQYLCNDTFIDPTTQQLYGCSRETWTAKGGYLNKNTDKIVGSYLNRIKIIYSSLHSS